MLDKGSTHIYVMRPTQHILILGERISQQSSQLKDRLLENDEIKANLQQASCEAENQSKE